MSSVFFSNFITSDVLQETRLKPWYETVRGYLVFTNIVVSIYMVYDSKSDDLLKCISANASAEFSAPTTAYVNAYCAADLLNWHQRNIGLVCLLSSVVLYLSFGWWLLIPSVKKSFLLIRKYDDQLQELQRGPSYLKSIIRKFYSNTLSKKEADEGETSKLISATQQVWYNHSGGISIFTIYLIRNAVSFAISGGAVALLTCLTANDIENPTSCQLDVRDGAQALCFVLAKDKLFPFVMTVISVMSTLGICALMLFVWFGLEKYGDCVSKLICQLLVMCRPTSHRDNAEQMQPENRQSNGEDGRQRFLDDTSQSEEDDSWKTKLEKRISGREKAWDFTGLDRLDLERIEHGEDCNRFVKLFSRAADPISSTARILMYFYLVVIPEDIRVCPERFSLLCPETKVKSEKTFTAEDETVGKGGNSKIFETLKTLHNDVKNVGKFDDFIQTHVKTFSNKDRSLNQLLDDRNDACRCRNLFTGNISLDGDGYSLMWHALQDLKSMSKIYLAAHLVLASIPVTAKHPPESVVVVGYRTLQSLRNYLQFAKAPKPEDEKYNRYIVKKMVDLGLERRRLEVAH